MQKVAVFGFGAMGQMHAQCYQLTENALVTTVVAGHVKDARERLDAMGCEAVIYETVDQAFESGDFDAVSLCLPTDMHVPVGIRVLEAGKHLLCEKPISSDLESAQKLVRAASVSGKLFMVAHCIRFWPEYDYLIDACTEDRYGALKNLHLYRRSSRPAYSQGNWLQDGKRSGGAILDLHIHDSDFIQMLLGMPKAVSSIGNHDETGWSYVSTQYHYDYDHVIATAAGGWDLPPKWGFTMGYQARFENAFLEFDFLANPALKLTVGDEEPAPVVLERPVALQQAVGNISDLGGYIHEIEYWIRCLELNNPITCATGEQAVDSLRLVFAEMESARTGGQRVTL